MLSIGFDTGTDGWGNSTNATATRDLAVFEVGPASMKITNTAASSDVRTGLRGALSGFLGKPPQVVNVKATVMAPVNVTMNFRVQWYDAANAVMTPTDGPDFTANSVWTERKFSAAAPVNAVSFSVRLCIKAVNVLAGGVHYVDNVTVYTTNGVMPMVFRSGLWKPFDGSAGITPPTPPGEEEEPPPGTPSGGMLVGASVQATTTSNIQPFIDLNNTAGPWQVRRSYNTNINASWVQSTCGLDVGKWASIWSAKPDLAQMASGALDNSTKAFLRSIPDDHVAFLTIWHEPDVKIKKGSVPWDAADYRAGFGRFCELVKEIQLEKPNIYTYICWGSYIFINVVPGATMNDLWPGTGLVDVVGFDGYCFNDYKSPQDTWGPGVDFAASKDTAWGIPEVGFGANATDPAACANWMSAQADYAANNGTGGRDSAAFLTWFNGTEGGVLAAPGQYPQTITRSAAISTQYFSPHGGWAL